MQTCISRINRSFLYLFDRVITEFLDFYLKGQKTVTESKVLDQHYRRYKL